MKKYIPVLLVLLVSLSSLNVQADTALKKFNIGIGSYALVVGYDNDFLENDELSGFGLSGTYAFTDQFAIRGIYYSLDHDDVSGLDNNGIDLLGYFGTGLATHGFKAYIGGGIFNETWKLSSVEEDFSGLQINGGLGYNWDVVALDFVLAIRDPGDYEEFANRVTFRSIDAVAISGSLMLSARF